VEEEAVNPLLTIEQLSISFAGLRALKNVSFSLHEGEILGLIGPNGAGKTTLLNCISGFYRPDIGRMIFRGQDLVQLRPHDVAHLGIARTFQNLELFPEATVLDNVVVNAMVHYRSNLLYELLNLPLAKRDRLKARQAALDALSLLNLTGYADQRSSELAFGIQKRVEIARAVAGTPKIVLLDEPAAGLNMSESAALGGVLRKLREDRGLTMVLIEHDMALVMNLCDRVVVLDHGEVIAEGTPEKVRSDPTVQAAYLGVEDAAA
jgi:branched-chain amino acid transport system ATP-binding protein